MSAALHVVKYLKGCPSKGLFLPALNSFTLTANSDADWASCPDSRRSLTGFSIFLGTTLVSWKTKKQTTVSRSTAEAEYHAAVCEIRWISFLLRDFGISVSTPVVLHCDHVVRNAYKEGLIDLFYVRSSEQKNNKTEKN
ncbi:UNVERIFIED_CONTAM: Retrovirus-related Pol polyprotein from transposon RE2, partial [Sesamum radiatum]